ncbi:MAG: hypothetical protein HOD60_06745 [Candidatus Nitrosopelagicus sp.]|jgi:hypothetical protein|nr:hypothetical protein [Candidatus Nitrosopelagicus sp.]
MKTLIPVPIFAHNKIKEIQKTSLEIISTTEEAAHDQFMLKYSLTKDAESCAGLATDVPVQAIIHVVQYAKQVVENIVVNHYELEFTHQATLEQINTVCDSVIDEIKLISSPYVVNDNESTFDFYK